MFYSFYFLGIDLSSVFGTGSRKLNTKSWSNYYKSNHLLHHENHGKITIKKLFVALETRGEFNTSYYHTI